MSLQKLIKNSEKIELSEDDISKIVDGKVNVISYEQLFLYTNIDEALGPHKALIVLYEVQSHTQGHWSLLYLDDQNTLHFFDPYGLKLDDEIRYIPDFFTLDNKGEQVPHLSYLVEKSGYKLVSNKIQYQKEKKEVQTCGRWCCVRLKFRYLNDEQFRKLWDKIPADDEVTYLTILYSL